MPTTSHQGSEGAQTTEDGTQRRPSKSGPLSKSLEVNPAHSLFATWGNESSGHLDDVEVVWFILTQKSEPPIIQADTERM